jgi:leader peptidase (prepilin peptidase)/N-methyltransferase
LSRYFDLHFSTMVWAVIIASPVIGSFLGLAIERLPAGRTILWGRSQCDTCGHPLGPLDLIPFVSWATSAFYPLIELAALVVAVCSATATSGVWFLASCAVGWTLLVVATIDWRKRRRFYVALSALFVWLACLYWPTVLTLLGPRAS